MILIVVAVGVMSFGLCLGDDKECAVVQTTDVRSPCYLRVEPSLQRYVPPFAYLANLPEPTRGVPCPVLQTLDPDAACFTQGRPTPKGDVPAYYLTVALPQGADDTEILVQRLRAKRQRAQIPTNNDDAKQKVDGVKPTYGAPR